MEPTRRFDYVLLDCDGTLLDTLTDLAAAGNHVCALHGWAPYSLDEYKRKVGNGQRVLASRIVPPGLAGDNALVDEVYQEFCSYYDQHKKDATAPYAGIVNALEQLHQAGVTLGVLTNKDQPAAALLIEQYFGSLLPVVQGRVDTMPAKPEPPMTLALIERLGAQPERTLMAGDTAVDIACGKNVGIVTCGVLWGFRDRSELERAGAEYLAETPAELVEFVLGR